MNDASKPANTAKTSKATAAPTSKKWHKIGSCVTTPIGAPGKCVKVPVPAPFFQLEEVTWTSKILVARNKSPIGGPYHWKICEEKSIEEEPVSAKQHYSTGSQRPGVYLFRGKGGDTLKVKLKVNGKNSGDYKLKGKFKGLNMEGNFSLPFPNGMNEDEVDLRITNLPDSLRHYEGDSEWEIEEASANRKYLICEKPRLEVFVVYNDPTLFSFYSKGVWVEALRLMLRRVGGACITGSKPDDISGKVAKYCHTLHGMRYDTKDGAAYFVDGQTGGPFKLSEYIQKKTNIVNCYDQAAAVQAFCGCLGVAINWLFIEPFGYIKTTKLVGIKKRCNNPFFDATDSISTPFANVLSINMGGKKRVRSGFGNHAFVQINVDSYIRDACAGPYVAPKIIGQYLKATIDNDHNISVNSYNEMIDQANNLKKLMGRAVDIYKKGPIYPNYDWAVKIIRRAVWADKISSLYKISTKDEMFLEQQKDGRALTISNGIDAVL